MEEFKIMRDDINKIKEENIRHDERIKKLDESHKDFKESIVSRLSSIDKKIEENNEKIDCDLTEIKDILIQAKGAKRMLVFVWSAVVVLCSVIAFLIKHFDLFNSTY